MASETGNVWKASDFFGSDSDGVEKFKTVALRALYDLKIEDQVTRLQLENEQFRQERDAFAAEIHELKLSMDINIEDRERVLAFKSKRIEELQTKVKDYEAVNASLLQTISGSPELTIGSEAGRNTGASMAILQRGEPLFHAVETCKEQEFKRLWKEMKLECAQLSQQIAENDTLVREMQDFQRQKLAFEDEIQSLRALMATTTVAKDEKIDFLERKLVFEHDRLTKEKDREIVAHQRDMEKQLRLQLDVTTQRTIEENLRVQLELRYQSTQLEKLVKQVDLLTAENRKCQHEQQLLAQMNATLSKKVKFYEHLFAKMQQHDQRKTKEALAWTPSRASPCSRNSRQPPLPSLMSSSAAMGMQSAFALSTVSSSPRSPISREREEDSEGKDHGSLSRLNSAALDALGDQLNTAGTDLDSHMIKREFTRKEVGAMLQCHHEPTSPSPVAVTSKKHLRKGRKMLHKTEYSPAKYTPRGARRFREAPLTLDSFLKEHATISPRSRSTDRSRQRGLPLHDSSIDGLSTLPAIGGASTSPLPPHRPPPRAEVVHALWKTPATEAVADQQPTLTARF